MKSLSGREKILLGLMAGIVIISSVLLSSRLGPEKSDEVLELDGHKEGEPVEDEPDEDRGPETILVYVTGNVRSPGVVELEEGQRLNDLEELVGGFLEDTDYNKINLAKRLEDEEKLYIPKIGELVEEEDLAQPSSDKEGRININKCSREELMTLPGIGQKKADDIISYREGTSFKSIEDIMEVSGIGEKTFDGFREMIVVK